MSSQFIFVIALLLMVASSSVVQGEKLLVTSGYQTFGFFKETQIIDLDYDSQVCQDGIPYPLEVYGAVGGLVGEKPVVCGGLINFHFETKISTYSKFGGHRGENNMWRVANF